MRTTDDIKNEMDLSDILIVLGSFLVWAEDDSAHYGGHDATEALDALRHLLGYDEDKFNRLKDIFK